MYTGREATKTSTGDQYTAFTQQTTQDKRNTRWPNENHTFSIDHVSAAIDKNTKTACCFWTESHQLIHQKYHFMRPIPYSKHHSSYGGCLEKKIIRTSGYAMVVHGRPKTPKNTSFLGVTQPPGVAELLYSRGHN